MLKLQSVRVKGFRGITDENTVGFDQPVTILFGENHQGKSSMLNAMEWCLFGDECAGANTGIRERIGWEIVNRRSAEARVWLELETDEGTHVLERSQAKGRKGTQFSLILPEGSVLEGEQAEQALLKLIRLSFRDFLTTVYQHQEAIRAVLTQEPRHRNDAIDRLLGLSDYRNILQGFAKPTAENTQKDIAQDLSRFEGELERVLKNMEAQVSTERERVQSLGLSEGDVTNERAVQAAERILGSVQSFAKDLGLPEAALTLPEDWTRCQDFCNEAETRVRELLRKSPDMTQQDQLIQQKQALDRAVKVCTGAHERLRTVREERDEFLKDQGTRQSLEQRQKAVSSEIEKIDHQISQEDQRAALVARAIQLLETLDYEPNGSVCPVCGSRVENLLDHLREEWERRQSTVVAALRVDKNQKVEDKKAISKAILECVRIDEKFSEASAEFKEASTAMAEALKREVAKDEDPVAVARKKLENVNEQLAGLEHVICGRQDAAAKIEAEVKKLTATCVVLRLEEKKRTVDTMRESKEFKYISQLQDRIAELVGDIRALKNAVMGAAAEEARSKIDSAQQALDEHFRALTRNPAVDRVRIEVNTKETGHEYQVLDQDDQELTAVLSQGDLNCLALALFLGLSRAAKEASPFGCLVFDDPSQSLGSDQKRRLAEQLEVAGQADQLVISTIDAELKDLLTKVVTKSKTCYNFTNWSPERGPKIVRE